MRTNEYTTKLSQLEAQIDQLVQHNRELEERNRELEEHNRELEEHNRELEEHNRELEAEVKKLKELLSTKGMSKGSKQPKFKLNYSVEKHRGKRQRQGQSRGRQPQTAKSQQVSKTVALYEPVVEKGACILRRQQSAWRIMDGRAQYVCYEIYALPETKDLPSVPGLRNSRSEYGIEIILTVAFLHYWIGISLDHVCEVLQFFTGLVLTKSQANSLLDQLSRDWADQYDTIAALLAAQLVIYIDETGWQVGKHACYTWAFSTAMHVLFRCGVGRGKAEAQVILGEQFGGIGVSDDYGAYRQLFSEHQLCWAHLLRKVIKLMLQHPEAVAYGQFLKALYRIYQQAVRWQKDHRLTAGRAQKVKALQTRILKLCHRAGETIDTETLPTHEQTFIQLQKELVNGLESLFVFVAHPEVEPTNNRSERNVRSEAEIRKGGRTSKSNAGAQRRSIIMTVLATLNTRFETFTLDNLLAEVARWVEIGVSVFQSELGELEKAHAPPLPSTG